MRAGWRLRILVIIFITLLMAWGGGCGLPANSEYVADSDQRPLVIVTADKADSLELLSSDLPGINQLLAQGACGLMNIRSGAGYLNSAGGYLTLGTGSRSTMPGLGADTYEIRQKMPGGEAGSYLYWSLGITSERFKQGNLVVPGIGWIKNQARTEERQVDPGRFGALLRSNGWQTCLIGNLDNAATQYRPGGLLLMDRLGIIDEGNIGSSILESDPGFPYQYRFSTAQVMRELSLRLKPRKVILVEFGDFYRLDAYRTELRPARYDELKQKVWRSFDGFIKQLLALQAVKPFALVVVSPSAALEGLTKKNLLGIIIISDRKYPAGLLASGTTKWPGLVANIDLLPTLLEITGLKSIHPLSGRTATVIPQKNYRQHLKRLNQRLIANNFNQRRILDCELGLIALGWIAGLLGLYLARTGTGSQTGRRPAKYWGWLGDGLITLVAVSPLSLLILPLFPEVFWQVAGFLALSIIIGAIFIQIKTYPRRFLLLSGLIWTGLILDQLCGWHLIRFSPLGYSAINGSRYYGMGNEFMGVFLAAALVLTHLLTQNSRADLRGPKWHAVFILAFSVLVFSLPQLGAKFGGILSGTAGFAYYLIRIYNVKLNNKRLWLVLGGCIIGLAAIGWWDSLRVPEIQTHIGRFVSLFFNRDFEQVGEIIFRKLAMNMKLTVFSPWMRIILLALALGIINRLVTQKALARPEDGMLWKAIIVTGVAAYLVNDAGVLAFATCLVYGFSYILLSSASSHPQSSNQRQSA